MICYNICVCSQIYWPLCVHGKIIKVFQIKTTIKTNFCLTKNDNSVIKLWFIKVNCFASKPIANYLHKFIGILWLW